MLHALLASLFTEVWPYLVPFVAALLAFSTGYVSSLLTARRTAATVAGAETASEKKAWRASIVLADQTNKEAIAKESNERVLWQLENAADWERVVGILKEFGEVQRQLAVVASTSQHHGVELLRLNAQLSAETQRLNAQLAEINKHLNDFIMRHVKANA